MREVSECYSPAYTDILFIYIEQICKSKKKPYFIQNNQFFFMNVFGWFQNKLVYNNFSKPMGQNQTNPFNESILAQEYQIQQKIPELFLTFLKRKSNNKEYLLRQLTFNEMREFSTQLQRLQKRKKIVHDNLTNLEIVEERAEDQMCSNFYKIYALWEYPKKTLLDDIASRTLENRPYNAKQVWNLLENCTSALALLQQNSITHECLTSKSILLEENGNIKVADPMSFGLTTNLELILSNRYNKSLYLSPQQCESLANHRPIINKSPYKNDVFIFALILLQTSLLEKQDKCFQQDCSVINHTVLNKNIARFGQKYGYELKQIIEMMTDRNIETLPDWISLQNIVKSTSNRKVQNIPIIQNPLPQINPQFSSIMLSRETHPQVRLVIPAQPTLPRLYQGIPLPTIPSVANEGSTSIRQYSNISSIPPNSFVSPVATSNSISHLNNFDRSQHRSTIQSLNPNPSFINHSFLPSNSIHPQSNSSVQGVNVRFNSYVPVNTDMTATFGTVLNQGTHFMQPNQRFINSLSPVPQRREEKIQNVPLSPPPFNENQALKVSSTRNNGSDAKLMVQNEPEQVYEQFSKGSRYNGFKLKGMRHGQGTFYYQDGGRYEGQWKQNKMNGFGKLYYQSDKLAYEGEWLNDQFHGKGKLYNQSPEPLAVGFDFRNFDDIDDFWSYYEGQFQEDLKNGSGKLRFSNGQLFQGTFVDDMVQGEGMYFCKDGQRVHGIWLENRLVQMLN